MFSEPTVNSVNNLFSAPGLGLELLAASLLACGVVCYMARVAWIALSHARRMESDARRLELEAMQAAAMQSSELAYTGPYCAG